ncbi:class I SAM-dependent methyltransferase [Oryzibacter oryziterrae]|uniref:class I SAM-dependent methyltransferase n=1 Tax=Oryzibacter oryziterrae TaxID=2766474 RepID=UPI001F3B365E|nr:class I SAM-dependent methyltransferase [Oryzibacter oryziterrae]
MENLTHTSNYDLREEIKAYWSERAATFDSQPGHEIFSDTERTAWQRLLRRHLGDGQGRRALDLASGTGVVSHLLDDLGFTVTGMDWAEPMLDRARAKARSRGRSIHFLMGDAERTMEPDDHYDVITNRHLVWTLVNPAAAFAEWYRVLKPGGQLLIVDGDFVGRTPLQRLAGWISTQMARLGLSRKDNHGPVSATMAVTHRSILSRVHFSQGARADAVLSLLERAGFEPVALDTDFRAIHKAQAANFGLLKSLERATQHRYAICVRKPGG